MLYQIPTFDERELEVLDRINVLKERLRWQLNEPRRWVGSLRRLSFARAIQGSNSIEGYDAKLDDAAAVALGEEPLDADEETRLALGGYRAAMTYVLQLAADGDFTYSSQLLRSIHFMMTSYSLSNRPGLWRTGPVYVQKEETGEIVYEGPDLDEVPILMNELSANLNSEATVPPIIRAGMAHLNLVMVHPFRDGNGRMARTLQSLVLARNGVLSPVFMSIEEYLGRNTQAYYDVLAEVGQGAWRPDGDARQWIRFILTAHLRQAATMLRRVRESEQTWVELEKLATQNALAPRILNILFDAALGMRVRNSTYRASLKDAAEEITEQTASRDLRVLVELGLLVPKGERRGRHYVAGNVLTDIRRAVIKGRTSRDDSDPFSEPPASGTLF